MMPWRFSLRELVGRPARAALTLSGIVLAVAAVVAQWTAAHTTRAGMANSYRALAGNAAWEVTAAGGGSFGAEWLNVAARNPALAGVAPLVERPTILYAGEGRRAKLIVMGVDFAQDKLVRQFELREGRAIGASNEVYLEAGHARSLGLAVDDQLRLLTKRGIKTCRVAGLLAAKGAAAFRQGGVVVAPLPTVQRWFKAEGRLDKLHVLVADDADAERVGSDLRNRLPKTLSVHRPLAQTGFADETMFAANQGIDLAGVLALLAAGLIIVNTLLMNVTERRRELAMLRAIGATAGQVRRLIFREALLYGAGGTVLGIAAGLLGAYALTRTMESILETPLPAIVLHWSPLALGVSVGLGVSLLAAYLPARKAGSLSPLAALTAGAANDSRPAPGWTLWVSLLVLTMGFAVVVGCTLGRISSSAAIPAAACMLAACVPLFAAALAPVVKALAALARPWTGVETQLALRQLLRTRMRTTFTASVVFVSAATAIGLGSTILNNTADVENWYRRTVVGDFFVRTMMPDMASGVAADMPDECQRELSELPGVQSVAGVQFVAAKAGGQSAIVIARPFGPTANLVLDLKLGQPAQVLADLEEGHVVVGSVLAQRAGLTLGDPLTIQTGNRAAEVRVAGIANEYLVGGLALYMERDAARRRLGIDGADAFALLAKPNQRDRLAVALADYCQQRGLLLQSYAELSKIVESMTNGIVGGLWVLLALGIVVSSCGMVNTLSMNVVEQSRELALMRATGMTRTQLGRMILAQAATIGLVGATPGVVVGMVMALLINWASLPVLGRAIDFEVHPWYVVACLATALIVSMISAWLPTRRAARLTVAAALRCE